MVLVHWQWEEQRFDFWRGRPIVHYYWRVSSIVIWGPTILEYHITHLYIHPPCAFFDVKSPRWLNVYSALISAEALLLLYPQENYFGSSATKGISLEIPPFHPNNQGKLRESTAPHRSNQRSSASLAVIALRAWHIETMWDTKTSLEEPPSPRFWDSHDLFVLKILQYLP